ncbi:TetR/AcrR family transcriptional regulator [Nonomuraea jiangxiensis]|uniref:DNA-binding transcriptional regulator, AcrR family n=1 Tax=Nonomuraea jiangxiensis TaxID=633440 RepID=A0A1G8K504_9ACTN|nr:TetR/AcrR family transcriptional regulator [Nonomuraea jiangxiensis]SDI38419.1 DNA-binding transcriptional regulator, AcrR family [Nonomuraea jiangxiensis]
MREDTRARIQEIALRLFTEQGYEATSLREIAEELGVTKAALYYHFKTKDDIVTSLVDLRVAELEKLLEWARSQEKNAEMRRELVRRYAEQFTTPRYLQVARFLERNQTALRNHPKLAKMREAMIRLSAEMCAPGAPATERIIHSLAFFALHAGKWLTLEGEFSDEEIEKASLEVALRLLEL